MQLTSKNILKEMEYLVAQPRRFYQDFDGAPPKMAGWVVLSVVSIEAALLSGLQSEGSFFSFIGASLLIGGFLSALNLLMVKMGGTVAGLFEKKGGDWKNGFTLLNIGLWPALIYFPAGFLAWFTGGLAPLKAFLLLGAILLIFKNWREALEVTFELTKVQSGLASYGAFIVGIAAILVAAYAAVIASFAGGA